MPSSGLSRPLPLLPEQKPSPRGSHQSDPWAYDHDHAPVRRHLASSHADPFSGSALFFCLYKLNHSAPALTKAAFYDEISCSTVGLRRARTRIPHGRRPFHDDHRPERLQDQDRLPRADAAAGSDRLLLPPVGQAEGEEGGAEATLRLPAARGRFRPPRAPQQEAALIESPAGLCSPVGHLPPAAISPLNHD